MNRKSYIGKTCPYCQFSIKAESELVICETCLIAHHHECWVQNGCCTTFGCGCENFVENVIDNAPLNREAIETGSPASLCHLPPGTILKNKYMLGRTLHQGNFYITYAALEINMDLPVLVKEFFPLQVTVRLPGDLELKLNREDMTQTYAGCLETMLTQAKKLARLSDHPNLETIRDIFTANNTAYMVLSCQEGVSLETHLSNEGGRLDTVDALKLLLPLGEALEALNEDGMTHLSVCPEIIIVTSGSRAVLTGCGFNCQALYEKSESLVLNVIPGYSAPEQYSSNLDKGSLTDLYAFAAVICRALTGASPPEAISRLLAETTLKPILHNTGLSVWQQVALDKALALKADLRHGSVKEFLEEMRDDLAVLRPAQSARKFEPAMINPGPNTGEQPGVKLYKLTYGSTGLALGDLPIGAKVYDPAWKWEFRKGSNYSRQGERKHLVWIVVASNHYGEKSGVTLLSEELIGKYSYNQSLDYSSRLHGNINEWESSIYANAATNVPAWLNSTRLENGASFYQAIANGFKTALLTAAVPNCKWEDGSAYQIRTNIFIPSSTELGDLDNANSYRIGQIYPYFVDLPFGKRIGKLYGETCYYWTRSPDINSEKFIRVVNLSGGFCGAPVKYGSYGVRPAVNMNADVRVAAGS